jgi:hypothetical protein
MPTESPNSAPGAVLPPCWSCGTVNKVGARFCRSCGASTDAPLPYEAKQVPSVEQEAQQAPSIALEREVAVHIPDTPTCITAAPRNSRKLVNLIAGISAALVLLLAFVLFFQNRSQPKIMPRIETAAPQGTPGGTETDPSKLSGKLETDALEIATAHRPEAGRLGQDSDTSPFFMKRAVADADLERKSAWELDVMRNEIYARHGRRFARKDLQTYFSAQPWYVPRYSISGFPASLLTAIQQNNALHIQKYQESHGLSK